MSLKTKILLHLRGEPNIKKLVGRGLKIGKNFKMMRGCVIDSSHCWHIEIGDNVILAPRVHILAHDASTKLFLNYTKVANVKIGNKVFIGAGSIILPGTTIGNNVVIGAGSIVSKNISDNSLVAGVPAKVLGSLQDYLNREQKEIHKNNSFDDTYTLRNTAFNERQRL